MPYADSPSATPATAARPTRQPRDSDSAASHAMFGPGVISTIAQVEREGEQ
jgi:hypothetical protein